MKLTTDATCVLRPSQLAALSAPVRIRADDLVYVHGVTRPRIVKIVHELDRARYLEKMRCGGFQLACAPKEVINSAVSRLTERPLELVECCQPEKNTCPLIGLCKLSQARHTTKRAFMAVLHALTRANIAQMEKDDTTLMQGSSR